MPPASEASNSERSTASDESARQQREERKARTARETETDRVSKIHEELRKQKYSGDFDVITPVILTEAVDYVGDGKRKRRLGKVVRARIVKECIEREKRLKGETSAAAGAANASPPMPSTTCAAFAVTNDDDAAAQPDSEFESESDPHSGLTSPRGVDADVTTISSINSNSNVEEDSKMPAVQEVTSSMSVSNVPGDDNNEDEHEDEDDNEMLDEADDADDVIALPPPPSFDEDHLQVIGEGIHQTKVAQVDVGNVGKTNSCGSLLYLPPKSWSPDHDMHPLRDAKIVLRTRFKSIPNEAVGGTERIRSLGPVHRSSDLYHTLILSTKNDEGTSVVLWKSVEEGRSWFISWLAVNAKCERKGYPTHLLRCIRDLAKGFGINDIYLEVGKSSTIRDGGEWDGVKVFYTKLGFIDAGDDVPDEVKACCQELAKGTHEVLKWDLNKRKLRASRRIRR